eukprot:scaffold1146_cov399-Prasinococcus_capsulatus_cf.AAC.31
MHTNRAASQSRRPVYRYIGSPHRFIVHSYGIAVREGSAGRRALTECWSPWLARPASAPGASPSLPPAAEASCSPW